jgi:polyhydroxyalkanoate synthesis regulator phasin
MKLVELQAHEELLKKADAGIEQMKKETESQICPETGRPGIFILNDDPRPNVREKIDRLRQEIAELEHKVNK